MPEEGARIDVWLWRARLAKTRALAAAAAATGRVRLTRAGLTSRIDKASRAVRVGDELVFVFAGRVTAVRILALGVRRGPPAEAHGLYEALAEGGIDNAGAGLTNTPAVSPSRE